MKQELAKYVLLALATAITAYSPVLVAIAQSTTPAEKTTKQEIRAAVLFNNTKGENVGNATLIQVTDGVLMKVVLKDLPSGAHAIHIHEKGACSPPATFADAGAHLNPGNNPHGFMAEHGPHAGDMPNITVAADGTFQGDILNENVTLDPNDTSKRALLVDKDGATIVVHVDADDYETQPSGDAKDRIACAEITKQ